MANANSPFGILPIGVQNNATPSFQTSRTLVPNTTGVMGRGDGLQKAASGLLTPIVAAGVTALQWAGIFWSCKYQSAQTLRTVNAQYYPGSGSAIGNVEVYYVPIGTAWPALRVRAQAAGTPFTAAMINSNMDITYVAPSATLRGGSSQVSIAATDGAGSTLPWRLVDLWTTIARDGAQDDTSSFNWGVFEFAVAVGI